MESFNPCRDRNACADFLNNGELTQIDYFNVIGRPPSFVVVACYPRKEITLFFNASFFLFNLPFKQIKERKKAYKYVLPSKNDLDW